MMSFSTMLFILLMCIGNVVHAQVLYVDVIKGNDKADGSLAQPFASIDQAVAHSKTFSGDKDIFIKIAPGLYTIYDQLKIEQNRVNDKGQYFIEAMVMPDEKDWLPAKMPVIQTVADSNRRGKLSHASIALQVERNNVFIRGLKFLGNPNPASEYFYAIERRNEALKNLNISQCYFLGAKDSAPIQGGVFAQGESIHIDHCVFYGCKNAVLSFLNVKDFSLTHSIIYGAYEGAVWFGYGADADLPFTFHNNIIANGNYFWVSAKGLRKNLVFSHSLISGNRNYLGSNGDSVEPDLINKATENHILKSGQVFLNEVTAKGVPPDHLNLSHESAGQNIDAGIFVKRTDNKSGDQRR